MVNHDAVRIAETFRLKLAGLTRDEIVKQLQVTNPLVGAETVESDLAMIESWQAQYTDPEQVRMGIALDLDALFRSILDEIKGNWISKQSMAKAAFYKEARETLLQKALLFGLNSQNVNVNQKTKLWQVIQELRADATQLETEANYPALVEPHDLPVAIPAAPGLLVESNSGDGW